MSRTGQANKYLVTFLILAIILVLSACAPPQPADTQPSEATEQIMDTEQSSGNGSNPPLVETFKQEDASSEVQIELPWQGRVLVFERKDFGEDLGSEELPEEFIRPIIYMQVVDQNSSNPIVHDFDPPLVMTAQYTPEDLEYVDNNPADLVIAIYNHVSHEWERYETIIDPENKTGMIPVSHWTSHACWFRK